MNDVAANTTGPDHVPKFGTFLGVYTPSALTLLGLIMYLRFGWVVGNLGLAVTVLVVLLATSITLITALSASALRERGHALGGDDEARDPTRDDARTAAERDLDRVGVGGIDHDRHLDRTPQSVISPPA